MLMAGLDNNMTVIPAQAGIQMLMAGLDNNMTVIPAQAGIQVCRW